MSKVKKPNGITLSRSGRKIKASWKKRDKYSTTQYSWSYGYIESEQGNTINHVMTEKLGTTSGTHSSITLPNKPIDEVLFGVRGKKGGKWSDWAEKAIRIYVPKTPKISVEFIQHAMSTFSWEPVTDKLDRPITDTKLQTILVQDCPDDKDAIASLPDWNDTVNNPIQSKSTTGSITPVDGQGEDTGLITGKSYTRIVRVMNKGIAGDSNWAYEKHIYADPYPAENIQGYVKKTEASLNCEMSWTTPTDAGHPIDIDGVIPQWSISTPVAGMECSDDAQFNSLSPQSSTDSLEKRLFTLDTPIGVDKCLFLRVVTLHDVTDVDLGVKSNAVLASGDFAGALKDPAFTEAPSIQDNTITIKATNESEVPDSFVVDFLERPDGTVEVLGLQDMSTKVYQVTGVENARVGLKAYVGDWDSTLKEVHNVLMESPMVWSAGSVPVAPSLDDFKVEQSIVPNTVNVTWKYSWDDADACEISWSTEPDAWISTEDPDSYIVLRGLEDKLAIKGIEAGVPLYVRIRYLNGVDEDAILSPYSDIKSVTVSTVPAVPTLNIEKQYFIEGEPITCSWIYVTTDGTEQAQAQIAEQIGVTQQGEPIFGEPIKVVTTEQKTVIPNTWEVGTQHAIAVSVANGSGNWSKWSQPVTVTIAEPVECHITQTSFETETHTGNPIIYTVEEDEGQEVKNLDVELTPVQDLHGYDKPWSGGAGKNKFSYKVSDFDNGSLYGQATFIPMNLAQGTYTISTNAPTGNLWLDLYQEGEQIGVGSVRVYEGNPYAFNVTETYSAAIGVLTADKAGALSYKTQLETGSTVTAYEPYENICPITGHDSVSVIDTGINQWDEEWEVGGISGSTGEDVAQNNTIRTVGYIKVFPNTSYYSLNAKTGIGEAMMFWYYDKDKTYLSNSGWKGNVVITTPADAYYMRFQAKNTYGNVYTNDISINYPSTDTAYHAYYGQSKTVTLPHTVYGAGVGVTSGSGTEKYGIIDLGTLTYEYRSNHRSGLFSTYGLNNYKISSNVFFICDSYRSAGTVLSVGDMSQKSNGDIGLYVNSQYPTTIALYVINEQYTDATTFKNAMSGVYLCYELATPTDLTTTPTSVELFSGDNVISSGGEMTMELDNYSLTELPMTVTVEGAGATGQTKLMIRRAEDYQLDRPDGKDYSGFKDAVVYQNIYRGEEQQTIQLTDTHYLDDGARYLLYAVVEDDYGQTDDDEIPFIVDWNHKAVMPSATVEVTDIAKITIAESQEAEEGDYVDIYRRSIDGAELIYTGAEFGETYVDPYPTIGNFGYVVVGRNAYGDFIMDDVEEGSGQFAWLDLPAIYESEKTIIDFDGEQIQLYYNVDISHSWSKDFKKTKYLGGSIVGDYVAGVERTGNVNFVSIPMVEEDMLESMRRLAEYEGNCHIRTVEGSSYTACMQVSEDDNHDKAGLMRNFSITVDKVEPTTLDGMTEEDWEAQNAVE